MKKLYYLILITQFLIVKPIVAQTPPISDTLTYIQNVVANKTNYIGQPFSVLLNQMHIQIKYFFPQIGSFRNRNFEKSTSFSFYNCQNANELHLTFPRIIIYWENNFNRSQSLLLYNQNAGQWTSAVSAYYANGIISDIQLQE